MNALYCNSIGREKPDSDYASEMEITESTAVHKIEGYGQYGGDDRAYSYGQCEHAPMLPASSFTALSGQ
jgi:hypothetical protein